MTRSLSAIGPSPPDRPGARRDVEGAIPADLAPCSECLAELFDPDNRRYRYPFINCARCGPRFSIARDLPYDRLRTTMAKFTMCRQCAAEFAAPDDRRFHAQANACPACGPALALWDATGKTIASANDALSRAVAALRGGAIVALKGVGGFQLLANALNDDAVRRLRDRKQRPDKPFALLVADIAAAELLCEVSPLERELLASAAAPIVLLARSARSRATVTAAVAPGNPNLGVMLPASPLHALLCAALEQPVVATSGKVAGEPICGDEYEALSRLAGIADMFLVHDQPIERPVDNSVARIMLGQRDVLRRARGYVADVSQPPSARETHVTVRQCVAELGLDVPALGVSWGGESDGSDGRTGGGDFQLVSESGSRLVARMRPFPLIGEDARWAPRRAALGVLYGLVGERAFDARELAPVQSLTDPEVRMLRREVLQNRSVAPTMSAGKLVDAVASLLGLRQRASFEGQAALELEFAATDTDALPYEFALDQIVLDGAAITEVDWRPTIAQLLVDLRTNAPRRSAASRFHATLVEMIASVAAASTVSDVVLCGACFQNRRLTEAVVARLHADGVNAYWSRQIAMRDVGRGRGRPPDTAPPVQHVRVPGGRRNARAQESVGRGIP